MQNSPARSTIDVGSVIADTYTIEAMIGRGGMGAVFLASHNRLPGKKVAIKVLHADIGGDEIHKRFKREAHIASMLSHPNIVHIEDYNVTADGMPYLVLEYLQGESLAQRLRRGPLPLDQVISIMRQVGSALATAHAKGVVHRDLKPQNIFLVPSEHDGRSIEIAKILDFGISKIRDSSTMQTQDNALLGTPQYMAPEQATGQHDRVDERTDIFALGAIVYEMLSGQPAFSGQSIPEVVFKVVYEQPTPLATRMPGLSESVTAAVQRAMSKPADERFATVSSFLEALTGAPVSLIRNPRATPQPVPDGSASGNTPHTGQDAFARTVGSGDHGASPVSVDAATVISQGGAPAADGLAGTVATGDQSKVAPPSGKRGGLIAIAVLVAAGATAAIMYVAMREPPAPPHQVATIDTPAPAPMVTPPPAVTAPPPAKAEPPPTTPPVAVTTPATTVDAGVAHADPVKPKKIEKQHVDKPIAPDELDGDTGGADDDAKRLKEAAAALAQAQWKKAAQAASSVTTSENAKPKQVAHAKMILGVVACNTNDIERGRNAVNALVGYPQMRDRVINACHDNDLLEGIAAPKKRR